MILFLLKEERFIAIHQQPAIMLGLGTIPKNIIVVRVIKKSGLKGDINEFLIKPRVFKLCNTTGKGNK